MKKFVLGLVVAGGLIGLTGMSQNLANDEWPGQGPTAVKSSQLLANDQFPGLSPVAVKETQFLAVDQFPVNNRVIKA